LSRRIPDDLDPRTLRWFADEHIETAERYEFWAADPSDLEKRSGATQRFFLNMAWSARNQAARLRRIARRAVADLIQVTP